MLLKSIILACSPLLPFALAQSSTSTSSSAAATHTVSVGATGLAFTPDTVTADVGDIVEYRFYPLNHSVARADFKQPCIPYELTGPGRVGFWAGFHPLNVIPSSPPFFQVKINDTSPIFFYCSAPDACTKDGMVGVINPNDTQTLEIQQEYAKNATIDFSPGEGFPVESASSRSSSAPTSTASASSSTGTATTTTPTSTPIPTAAAASSKPALSTGAIAGIAIGGVAVAVLAGALIYLCGRQRTLGEMVQQQNVQHAPPTYMPPNFSMAPSATSYPPKTPKFDVDSLGAQRCSAQGGFYDRSTAETESYRSRSPPVDDGREYMMPIMNLGAQSGTASPGSPTSSTARRPGPERPSPVSPMNETIYQPMSVHANTNLRVERHNSQRGPHELDVDSGRNEFRYHSNQEYGHNPDPGTRHF